MTTTDNKAEGNPIMDHPHRTNTQFLVDALEASRARVGVLEKRRGERAANRIAVSAGLVLAFFGGAFVEHMDANQRTITITAYGGAGGGGGGGAFCMDGSHRVGAGGGAGASGFVMVTSTPPGADAAHEPQVLSAGARSIQVDAGGRVLHYTNEPPSVGAAASYNFWAGAAGEGPISPPAMNGGSSITGGVGGGSATTTINAGESTYGTIHVLGTSTSAGGAHDYR